jgi:hypothetical protein
MASSLSASWTTASSLHPPLFCISATSPSHCPAARSFFSVDHEILGIIDRRSDVWFSERNDLAILEWRKGARTVSREDVSAYLAKIRAHSMQDERKERKSFPSAHHLPCHGTRLPVRPARCPAQRIPALCLLLELSRVSERCVSLDPLLYQSLSVESANKVV